MPDFYTITQDEFETAARFLQVVALMEAYSQNNYERYFYSSTSGYYSSSEERNRLREWLDSQIPTCANWTSDPAQGTTVQWDGTVLSLRNRKGVLAEFNLPQLLEEQRRHDRYAHIHGADVTNNAPHNAFEGRTDLRELVGVGTLGRVLSLLPKKDASLWGLADARERVRRTLQDAGIYVEPSASDSAFDDSLIVWGYYGAPIEAIERQERAECKKKKVAVLVPPLPKVFHWMKSEPKGETEPEPTPMLELEHKAPEPDTEPETAPERKRRNLWGWALVAVELLAIVGICLIYTTQGPYSSELAVACGVASILSAIGITVLKHFDTLDE